MLVDNIYTSDEDNAFVKETINNENKPGIVYERPIETLQVLRSKDNDIISFETETAKKK